MDCLTNNIVKRLKVSSIRQFFDNIIYESNILNDDFNYLPFDGEKRLITGRRLYCINYNTVFRLKNGSSVDK